MKESELVSKIKQLENKEKTLATLLEISSKDDGLITRDFAKDMGSAFDSIVTITKAESIVKKW